MASTETLTITVPTELAARIRARVEAGAFESESDLFVESLLQADVLDDPTNHPDFERWMREECLPTLERMKAGTEKMYSLAEAREKLAILGIANE
jgi:antitoxin ParD1/3/4